MICRYLKKILVVMALITIKQTKKRWVVNVMSFNTTARIDNKCHISVFYCKHTNNQFFISGTSTLKVEYFSVFGHDFYFFSWPLMDPFMGGASFQDCTWLLFFHPCTTSVLDAFLKKRMALSTWKSKVKCWMHNKNFYIRVTVIESWWKIKFTKQQKNSSACFPPVT